LHIFDLTGFVNVTDKKFIFVRNVFTQYRTCYDRPLSFDGKDPIDVESEKVLFFSIFQATTGFFTFLAPEVS